MNYWSSSASHNPMALTAQAEVVTIAAAKIGGTNMSTPERFNSGAGKQKFWDGRSNGSLTEDLLHAWDREEVGVTADTNAISGVNDAMATVTVKMLVHEAA